MISLISGGYYESILRDNSNITTYSLNFKKSFFIFVELFKLIRLCLRIKPNIIMGWMYHGNIAAVLVGLFLPKNRIYWNIRQSFYKDNKEKIFTRIVIFICKYLQFNVHKIIYNSEISKKHHELIGFKPRLGAVIHNGFDIPSYEKEKKSQIKRDLGIASSSIIVGHVARFHHMKDHANFLKAIVPILEKRKNIIVIFIGKDINLNNKNISKNIPINLEKYFYFLGEKDNAISVMSAFDIFCLSSSSESFPNVVAEAMSVRVPVVSTDVGDVRKIIGDSGIVVPAKDSIALQNGINYLVNIQVDKRDQLGLEAQLRIKTLFSLSSYCNNYQNEFFDL